MPLNAAQLSKRTLAQLSGNKYFGMRFQYEAHPHFQPRKSRTAHAYGRLYVGLRHQHREGTGM